MKDNTTRRDFMLAGTAIGAGLAAANMAFADSPKEDEAEDFTAEQALQRLIDGNRRFVTGKSKHPHMTEDWLKRQTKGQRPIATILACSDSRVPLELLFDQGLGDLFVIRVAGNIVTRYGIGTMEYAQHHLGTPLYMVLGHEGCGAVTAAMLPKGKRDKEPKGVRQLLNLVNVGKGDSNADAEAQLAAAVEANVRNSSRQILELDPKAEGFHMREGDMLVSAVYELSTGRVRILEKHE
jgi:carbonic anhydrase